MADIGQAKEREIVYQPIDPVEHPYPTRRQLVGFSWQNGDRRLVAEYATPNNPSDLQRDFFERDAAGHWQALASVPETAPALSARVHEALDSAPVKVTS